MAGALRIEYPGGDCQVMARMRSAASRNQKILQKETKQTKTGENFAKNPEFLEIALQGAAVKAPLASWRRNPIQARVRGFPPPPAIVTAADGITALEIREAEEKSVRAGTVVTL